MLEKNIIKKLSELNNWLNKSNLLEAMNPFVLKDRSALDICLMHLLLEQKAHPHGLPRHLACLKYNCDSKIKKLTKHKKLHNKHIDYARAVLLNENGLDAQVICNPNYPRELKCYTEFKSQLEVVTEYGTYSTFDELVMLNDVKKHDKATVYNSSLIVFPFKKSELKTYTDNIIIKKPNGLFAYKFDSLEDTNKSPLLHFDSRDGTLRRLFIRASADQSRNNADFKDMLDFVAPPHIQEIFIKNTLATFKNQMDDELHFNLVRQWLGCIYDSDLVDKALHLYSTHNSPDILYMSLTGELNQLDAEPSVPLDGLLL